MSFPDSSIDLILSSDVLEHMPDPYAAHAEIHRVLHTGGRHIFTVPFIVDAPEDDVRARLEDGKTVHLKEQLFHGDPIRPDEGVLVWTIFGMEMLTKLNQMGFETTMWLMHEPVHGILGDGNSIFEARKI